MNRHIFYQNNSLPMQTIRSVSVYTFVEIVATLICLHKMKHAYFIAFIERLLGMVCMKFARIKYDSLLLLH